MGPGAGRDFRDFCRLDLRLKKSPTKYIVNLVKTEKESDCKEDDPPTEKWHAKTTPKSESAFMYREKEQAKRSGYDQGLYGIFTVPENQPRPTLAEVEERVSRAFNCAPVGRWHLALRQFRSTVPSAVDAAPRGGAAAPTSLQVLSMSTGAGPPEVTVTSKVEGQPQTFSGIGSNQFESFLQLVTTKLGGLWTLRPPGQVASGSVYDIGEFLIRVGELRPAGSQTASRGLIVMIEEVESPLPEDWKGPSDFGYTDYLDPDSTVGRDMLKEIWNRLHIGGAKEFFGSGPRGAKSGRYEEAQLVCEALRLR
ncbi:MAG: hypothetical protein M1821_001684 [Bathelium mastoideum]|nr:MAG: hypothetical protein M1821_001684 [Bathelium mastoideum]